jgi:hypothetical protein
MSAIFSVSSAALPNAAGTRSTEAASAADAAAPAEYLRKSRRVWLFVVSFIPAPRKR